MSPRAFARAVVPKSKERLEAKRAFYRMEKVPKTDDVVITPEVRGLIQLACTMPKNVRW